jgi:hypothetical protein
MGVRGGDLFARALVTGAWWNALIVQHLQVSARGAILRTHDVIEGGCIS